MGSETVQKEYIEDVETDDLEIFLTELAEYYSEYELQPGEFTVNNVIARVEGECDRSRVTSDLHRRVKTGELGAKQEKVDGRRMWVFWQIKNPAG